MAKSKYLLGLDIGASAVKACLFKETRRGLELQTLDMVELPGEAVVEGEVLNAGPIVDAIRELVNRNRIKQKECAMMVTGYSLIIKRIALPTMTKQELESEIQFEAAPYIPFDINDVYLDYEMLGSRPAQGQMDILLIAAKKDIVNSFAAVGRDAGLETLVMDAGAFALQNMFEYNYGMTTGETLVLVDVGASWTNIAVLNDGMTAFTRDVSTAGISITEEIQKQLGVAFETAEDYKRSLTGDVDVDAPPEVDAIVAQVCDAIAGEVQRSLDFYSSTATDSVFSRVMLTGGTSRLPHLVESITNRCGLEVELINPLMNMAVDGARITPAMLELLAPRVAVSVGLGLRRSDQ